MKSLATILVSIFSIQLAYSQTNGVADVAMTSNVLSENPEISDILQFEGIAYLKLKFEGKDLADKSYHISVKEIWDGKVKSDSTVINSAKIGYPPLEKINDTVFNLKIISKLTDENKLKMTFKFPGFVITKNYDALDSEDYSLRNVAETNKTKIKYGEKFYLLAYILP